ncbi:MAG: hypothetical protein ACK4NR_01645 [Micavibrio sp.]
MMTITGKELGKGRKLLLTGIVAALLTFAGNAYADHEGSDGALDQGTQQQDLEDALNDNWLPTIPEMADQFSATMIHQIFGIGALLDAKHQLETQRLLGQLRAEAHKNYRSSNQMCRYGTNVRSLATTEARALANKSAMSQVLQQRILLKGNSVGSAGRYSDLRSRFDQFRSLYCNPEENDGDLWNEANTNSSICLTTAGATRLNNDIDYTRMLDSRLTVDVNFTDATQTDDETDLMAMGRNLYSHQLLDLREDNVLAREGNLPNIMNMRSLHAMRGISHNSFAEIVGMKAAGSGTVGTFMRRIIEELDIPAAEVDQFLGANPSYFAQMEVLTRKMYHNPDFYTNLYTSPENLKRTSVALQALQIMHDRDRFEASLRREMLLSSILEMRIRDAQEVGESQITGRANSRGQ